MPTKKVIEKALDILIEMYIPTDCSFCRKLFERYGRKVKCDPEYTCEQIMKSALINTAEEPKPCQL